MNKEDNIDKENLECEKEWVGDKKNWKKKLNKLKKKKLLEICITLEEAKTEKEKQNRTLKYIDEVSAPNNF